jgi:hypothetical protein
MKKNLFLLIGCFIFLSGCNKNDKAKPDHSGLFIKFFGGAKSDDGFSVKESGDGGFVIVGSSINDKEQDKNLYIVKTDSDGNKIWDYKFGGAYDQEGFDVKVDANGNYLVAGSTKDSTGLGDFLVLQYSKDGILMKTFVYGQPDRNEVAKFITITSDGKVLVAGSKQQLAGPHINMYLLKTNLDTLVWEKDLGIAALYDTIGTIVEMPDKNLLWCGTVSRGNETDVRISMTDEYSNLNWDYSIGEGDGMSQTGKEIQATSDGNYIIGGSQTSGGSSSAFLVKVNPLGTVLWKSQPGGNGKTINSVASCSDGGFILTGTNNNDYLLLKTDADGGESWEKTYGGSGLDKASKVIQTGDGGFLMIGTVTISNNTTLGLMKANSKGEITKK